MKFILLLVMFLSLNASASPIVGDFARVHIYGTTPQGVVADYEIKYQIISINPSNDTGVFHTTITKDGVMESEGDETHTIKVMSAQYLCYRGNGVLDQITVKAGTFEVCHVSNPAFPRGSADYYNGAVLFGLVKSIYQSGGNTLIAELVELVQH